MTDRDVYLKLSAVAEELRRLSSEAESLVGEAALQSAANTLKGAAQVIYDHCLNGEGAPH